MSADFRRVPGGLFITLEGGEGSGKSTLLGSLRDFLRAEGLEVVESREPGGPAIAERIREILLDPVGWSMDARTELFLYLASRRQNVVELIRPALERGAVVLCDRYLDASVAYQGGGRGLGEEKVERLNREAVEDTLPDLTFLLDLDPEIGLARGPGITKMEPERGDRIERAGMDFHRRVRESYHRTALRNPERFVLLDASSSPQAVADQALELLRNLLSRKA